MTPELRQVNQLITRYQAEQRQGAVPISETYLAECPEEFRWLLGALIQTTDEIYHHPEQTTEAIGRLNELVSKRAS